MTKPKQNELLDLNKKTLPKEQNEQCKAPGQSPLFQYTLKFAHPYCMYNLSSKSILLPKFEQGKQETNLNNKSIRNFIKYMKAQFGPSNQIFTTC